MARVFLLNPPTPEPVKSPLLAFCYLAASLEREGHTVAVLDASAPFAPKSGPELVSYIEAFAPDLVGLHVKTLSAQESYATIRALGGRWKVVVGGPHATVCPEEPLRFGADFVLRGEAEESLPLLASHVDGRVPVEDVPALTYPGVLLPKHNASRGFLRELDALASPLDAVRLFDPAWYGSKVPLPPVGLLSSRGCPANCTFCSNNVTGRQFRYRNADLVAKEAADVARIYGHTSFSFFDDSFAVGRRRMHELCDAMVKHAPGVHWTCTAHPSHLDREILSAMKAAGCGGIDIGMESGDPEMLLRIGKGVTTERVREVLGWARELGLHMVLNIMFGWPDETEAQLRTTLEFMDEVAPVVSAFNARGVLVPYPGTELYDKHHAAFGFTEWWIREPPIPYEPFPAKWDVDEVVRAYSSDAALARNFFRHPPEVLELMQYTLKRKAEHTFRALLKPKSKAAGAMVPAAGAR